MSFSANESVSRELELSDIFQVEEGEKCDVIDVGLKTEGGVEEHSQVVDL